MVHVNAAQPVPSFLRCIAAPPGATWLFHAGSLALFLCPLVSVLALTAHAMPTTGPVPSVDRLVTTTGTLRESGWIKTSYVLDTANGPLALECDYPAPTGRMRWRHCLSESIRPGDPLRVVYWPDYALIMDARSQETGEVYVDYARQRDVLERMRSYEAPYASGRRSVLLRFWYDLHDPRMAHGIWFIFKMGLVAAVFGFLFRAYAIHEELVRIERQREAIRQRLAGLNPEQRLQALAEMRASKV
jgi:hypothetical protein